MVYKAEVTSFTTYKEYYGTSEEEYNNHIQSFRHISHINDMELSKHISTLKANGTDFYLKWSIKLYASQYECGIRRFDLYMTKKVVIPLADPKVLLNKRTELISYYHHRNNFILNYQIKDV